MFTFSSIQPQQLYHQSPTKLATTGHQTTKKQHYIPIPMSIVYLLWIVMLTSPTLSYTKYISTFFFTFCISFVFLFFVFCFLFFLFFFLFFLLFFCILFAFFYFIQWIYKAMFSKLLKILYNDKIILKISISFASD